MIHPCTSESCSFILNLTIIHRFATRSLRFMDGYRKGNKPHLPSKDIVVTALSLYLFLKTLL
ncbi:hypothetical protein M405DRAFT_780443 [Rhizopogon salebrosus TDB-379]|nr:hypothetical protein M405DRAFT_780443 [Rhizopogon salebrosus TDB-379]